MVVTKQRLTKLGVYFSLNILFLHKHVFLSNGCFNFSTNSSLKIVLAQQIYFYLLVIIVPVIFGLVTVHKLNEMRAKINK